MSLTEIQGPFAYVAVFVAAILEGEILFVTAATLVSRGLLGGPEVAVAGALGAAVGDQIYFYALRGRLNRWLARFPRVTARGERLARRVRRNETLTVFLIRFSPGLRVALAVACAYAGVPALKFSLLNGLACLIWSTGLLALVAWFGPIVLGYLGLSGWWAALVPAVLIVIMFRWLGHEEREELERTP